MDKKFLVVANGEPPSLALIQSLVQDFPKLIAVDGGLITCHQLGLQPELIIGDFDSISQELLQSYSSTPQMFTPDQNKSDLEKTLEYLLSLEAKEITVCGALGRRLDHTLTNICLLTRYPGKVKFESDTETCFALNKENRLSCHAGQNLSLIPLSSQAHGVTTEGLEWELKNATLDKHFFSISNVCLKDQVAISFTKGDVVVCLGR